MAIIISAFPGCGKTHATQNLTGLTMLDSDSSGFSWLKDENGDNTTTRNDAFPQNYIEHILSNMTAVDVIFVSSHTAVRKALTDSNIHFYTVYPEDRIRQLWCDRLTARGSSEAFVNMIYNNWDSFMTEIASQYAGCGTYRLGYGVYISDILPAIQRAFSDVCQANCSLKESVK